MLSGVVRPMRFACAHVILFFFFTKAQISVFDQQVTSEKEVARKKKVLWSIFFSELFVFVQQSSKIRVILVNISRSSMMMISFVARFPFPVIVNLRFLERLSLSLVTGCRTCVDPQSITGFIANHYRRVVCTSVLDVSNSVNWHAGLWETFAFGRARPNAQLNIRPVVREHTLQHSVQLYLGFGPLMPSAPKYPGRN